MNQKEYIEELESALIDLLDGISGLQEMIDFTGLSDERCLEIEALFNRVVETYKKKHGITS